MIEYVIGDILTDDSDAIVCPVNCVGVMGAGLAKKFKIKWPKYYDHYYRACKSNNLKVGMVNWYFNKEDHSCPRSEQVIISFPTKDHWTLRSTYLYIDMGLKHIVETLNSALNIRSIAFPKLGCGLGKLEWNNVKPIIEKYFNDQPIRIRIRVYE